MNNNLELLKQINKLFQLLQTKCWTATRMNKMFINDLIGHYAIQNVITAKSNFIKQSKCEIVRLDLHIEILLNYYLHGH